MPDSSPQPEPPVRHDPSAEGGSKTPANTPSTASLKRPLGPQDAGEGHDTAQSHSADDPEVEPHGELEPDLEKPAEPGGPPPGTQPPPPSRPPQEVMQEEIHQKLIEGELAVRRWLASPQGQKAIDVAKVAAPAIGLAAVAGYGAWSWWQSHRRSNTVRRRENVMAPLDEEGRPSLGYVKNTLLDQPKARVVSLIGKPDVEQMHGHRWLYGLDGAADPREHDFYGMAVIFDADDRVADVTFLAEENDD